MAKYIFKVKKVTATRGEIVGAVAYDVDSDNLPTTAFATYYVNKAATIKLKDMGEGNDAEPWVQHKPHFVAGAEPNAGNAKESLENSLWQQNSADLDRADGSSPLYVDLGSGATFGNIQNQSVIYCKENNGLGKPATGGSIQDQYIRAGFATVDGTGVIYPLKEAMFSMFEVKVDTPIRAGDWVRNQSTSGATVQIRQLLAVVKFGYTSNPSVQWSYRVYVRNQDGGNPVNPGSSDDLAFYPSASDADNGTNKICTADASNGEVTRRQAVTSPGAGPAEGNDFFTAHIFMASELGSVVPVVNKEGAAVPSRVGISPDPGTGGGVGGDYFHAGTNLKFGEFASNEVVVAASNYIDDNTVSSPGAWSTNSTAQVSVLGFVGPNDMIHSGDYFVEVKGTAAKGYGDDTSGESVADIDWFKYDQNSVKFFLGQYQNWGWAEINTIPPATTTLTTNASASGCNVTVNITALAGYSTPLRAYLVADGGAIGSAIRTQTGINGTGSFTFSPKLGHATYDIPSVNPNIAYDVLFAQNGAYSNPLPEKAEFSVENCPFFVTSASAGSGCELTVNINNIYGFAGSGQKIKLRLLNTNNDDLVNGSGNPYTTEFVGTGGNGPATNSNKTHTFDLSDAVNLCDNQSVRVKVMDESDSGITMEQHSGNFYFDIVMGQGGCGACFAASGSANNCIVSFNVTTLNLPADQLSMKGHLWKSDGPGDTPNFSERLTTPAPVSFNSTGTKSFTSLNTTADPAYIIPTNNPNGTYNVMFSDADDHTALSNHNVTTNDITVDTCPWFTLAASNQSACEISVQVNSVYGYASNSIKVKLYNSSGAALVNGSGSAASFEHTITNPAKNSNNSHTFDVSTASPGLCTGDTVRVAVIDVGANANITMQAHGAHYEEVVLGAGCGTPSITTTVAQSSCQITGQVDSISCVPAYDGGSNRRIKAEFWKNTGSFTHLDGSDVIITNTFGSAVSGFNLTGSVVSNAQYQIKWYYQTTSGGSWTFLKQDSLTVNSCPTFSGSAAESTSPKCGINVTVNWSATSNLGSTIRAVVFVDTNGNGVLNGGESAVVGAKNAAGATLDFSANPTGTTLDFDDGSGTETHYVDLDAVSDPNAKYIVEFQADPDGNGTFHPLNVSPISLSTSDTYKAVTIDNCTPCANNATPFYYFEVSGGNITTNDGTNRGVRRCDDNAFTAFAGGYCKTNANSSNWTILGKAGGGQWSKSDFGETSNNASNFECLDGPGQADSTSITVRLYGSHLQTGQPLGVFTSGSSWTTPLADGLYVVCNTTFPTPDADPCTTTHAFQIDANGKIVSTNGLSGSNLRAAAFSGTFAARAATHTWGTGSNFCYSGTAFTYEPVVHSSEAVARGSLGCGGKTGGTLYLFGNAITGLYVHTANNAASSNRKTGAAGWYTTCVEPAAGTNPCASTEHFLQITSAHGDWDGKIYNSSGSAVTVHATSADWFEESPISGWTAQSVGTGWTGANPAAAEAINLCSDSYVNANTGSNILYISGTLVNGRTNADKLRIYRGAGLTNPLAAGWYRYCGTPPVPKVNGVPEFREKFNCYGNPFSWWSANPRETAVLDGNGYLTNGIDGKKDWWRDAPVKDLTDTNNDLGIYKWVPDGDTKKGTIQRTTVSRSCITNHQNGGGSTQNKDIFQFTASKKKHLSRSPFYYHPDYSTGQTIISSAKTSATEITAAIVFDSDSADGMILTLSDIIDSSGEKTGSWASLEKSASAGNTITESVLVFKKSGSSQVTLQTQKRTLTWNNSNKSASWGSWTQSAALTATVSGYAIAVIKAAVEGHTIRINGAATASNTSPSLFCDGNKGISNLNTEIGGDDGNLTPTMKLSEVILYDDELNYDEMQELEGWLAERWCKQLSQDSHPWYADGPNCSTCESQCCEAEVTVSTSVTGASHKVEVTASYKSSESVFGYQFKLSGLSGLNITPGVWKQGDTITTTVSGKTFSVTFSDPFAHGFKNYLVSDASNNIWVVGHFYDSGSGDYDKVLPPKATATSFTVITITETSSSKVQNWGGISGTIVTNNSKLNNPAAPHPILATYYPSQANRQRTPVSTYNGDSTGDGTVTMTDVDAIISRIPKSNTPFDLDVSGDVAESWMETLDASGKGWLDITDVITTLLNLKTNGTGGGSGTPISNSATVKSAVTPTGLLSVAACINKMYPTECEPCPCPDVKEPEECVSKVWISDIQPVDKEQRFAVLTISYQSSCCIDGYKLELGGFDPSKVGNTGYHDGVVYAPSTGNDIGQQVTESHSRDWLHGTTLDPTYSGDIASQNGDDIWAWQAASSAGIPLYLMSTPKTKFNFPIVWGMSIATLASASLGDRRTPQLEKMIRLGYGCIPATCDGKSKILTKFVVNMRTFMARPYIKSFRLVTNDDLVTPASFNTGSGITWTGDGADGNAAVDSMDWIEVLFYLNFGWGRTTSWSDSSEQTANRNKIRNFSAENDDAYLDVVDALTVSNHMLKFGPKDADTSAKVVPTDCCECPLPGTFKVTSTAIPCNCWEEGYKRGREGQVTLNWSASSGADNYTILRFVENRKTTNAKDKTGFAGWHADSLESKVGKSVGGSDLYRGQYTQNYKQQQEAQKVGKWETVARLDGTATSWIDNNPPKYRDCCPDDVLPKVVYVVIARNDCGEVSAQTSHEPNCCGTAPEAYNVAIGKRTVNQQLNMMASAYHPFAASPYGGIDKAAEALVTFTGIPADNVTMKVIDYLGVAHTFKFKAGGGTSTSTLTFINTTSENTVTKLGAALVSGLAAASVSITGVNSSGAVTMTQIHPVGHSKSICGNTKITVSDAAAITLPATGKFTGGNSLCTKQIPGYPAVCEDLTFKIFKVKYSNPTTGPGRFVGPGDGGGALPVVNRTGKWLWIPPTGYLGDVTFFYKVRNESGCEDIAKITVSYLPVQVKLECHTFPCNHPKYGQVILKFDKPKGIIGEARILRKLSTDGSAWDTSATSSQIITDSKGRKVIINLTTVKDEKIMIPDTTANLPDECCTDDLIYDYKLVICQINDYVIASQQQGRKTVSRLYCTESSICRVTIPCCPKPKNPIPELCVSDCDGVAAEASLVFHSSNFNSVNNATIAITNTAGTTKTYKIKNDASANASNQEFNSGASRAAAAENLAQIIEGSSGHDGTIYAYDSAGRRWNHGSKDFTDGKVVLKQVVVGDAGNTTITTAANFDNLTSTNATAFRCGFDAAAHPAARISWSPIQASDKAHGYNIWRKLKGTSAWQKIGRVMEDQAVSNTQWDSVTGKYFLVDKNLKSTKFCEPGIQYSYAVTAVNKNGNSGHPRDATWGSWSSTSASQGDKCSPGGTTLEATIVNCPPTPCLEEHDVSLCLDTAHSIDVKALTGCIPKKADGKSVAVTYSIVSSASWVTPSISDGVISFNTEGINFGSVGAGPHNSAIVWRVTVGDSDCPSTTDQDINITLVDCGCPCPDDEKDYTICDVNFDNAEYVANDVSTFPLIRKLVDNKTQIPFSLGREGGQNLRKAKPYMVSKGEIDQS
mgnify:CR=1 FL=1